MFLQDFEQSNSNYIAHHFVSFACQMQPIIPELVARGFVECSIRDCAVKVKGVANSQVSIPTQSTGRPRRHPVREELTKDRAYNLSPSWFLIMAFRLFRFSIIPVLEAAASRTLRASTLAPVSRATFHTFATS